MDCAILSSHRTRPPQGIAGGGDGRAGKTEVRRLDGRTETLAACAQTRLPPGEAVTVTTPTPGGYGVRRPGVVRPAPAPGTRPVARLRCVKRRKVHTIRHTLCRRGADGLQTGQSQPRQAVNP